MVFKFLGSIFRFRKTSVSLLLVATYLVLGFLLTFDRLNYKRTHPTPQDFQHAPELLENSWLDLQVITKGFHPYFSRDNMRVHDYLFERISNLTDSTEYIDINDDVKNKTSIMLKSNDPFNPSSQINRAFYFEAANILVKIKGKNSKLPGLLISAHYDSVPTSHGATDDGKGIVTLLGILGYYSRHQPDRTIILNFNDNEEFGLLGAEAFMAHSWSRLVKYVVNLEGTGTGGKAVLFRASDTSLAKIYQKAVKKMPFGTSIYQQGFNDGNVKSQTDYVVYTKYGLRGLDIAFYKPRDLYHTIKDSIQYTSREALWHMFHTTWQIADYVSNNSNIDENDLSPAIFFDTLGIKFFAFSAKTLFKWNCVILSLCPIALSIFYILSRKKNVENRSSWSISFRLPFSLLLSVGIVWLTNFTTKTSNPFIISRNYFLPLFALSAEFLLLNYLTLSVLEFLLPTQDLKTTIFHQLTAFVWIILFFCTVNLYREGYRGTGTYICTFIYVLFCLGTLFGLLCRLFRRRHHGGQNQNVDIGTDTYGPYQDNTSQNSIAPHHVDLENSSDVVNTSNDIATHSTNHDANESTEASQLDERAPLLQTSIPDRNNKKKNLKNIVTKSLNYDWSVQFLIAVPLITFFVLNSLDLILDGIHQTIQEGKDATRFVWFIVFLGSIGLSLPVLPFVYKINCSVGLLFSSLFFILYLLSMTLSPFSTNEPMKLRFSQYYSLSEGTEPLVSIHGRSSGLILPMLSDLPSIKEMNETISCEPEDNGMEMCSYHGLSPNLVDSDTYTSVNELFSIKALENDRKSPDRSLYAPINARFRLKVKENRACSLWFNNSSENGSPVRQVTIYKSAHSYDNKTKSESIRINTGINQLHLYKLDFDEPFYDIGVQWLPKIVTVSPSTKIEQNNADDDILDVSISCYWGEYDSESIIAGQHLRKIPAYDELLAYAPLNYSFTNYEKGLVKISDRLQL